MATGSHVHGDGCSLHGANVGRCGVKASDTSWPPLTWPWKNLQLAWSVRKLTGRSLREDPEAGSIHNFQDFMFCLAPKANL